MYFIPELLKKRSGGQLARCWLAGTLSETQFRKICNHRQLLSIDIEKLCDDILGGTVNHRFSLYLSSQLVHGLSRLQLYKTQVVEDSCRQLEATLVPVKAAKKRRSKPKKDKYLLDQLDFTTELVAPPSFSEEFLQNLQRPDLHLMPELDQPCRIILEAEPDDFGERQFDLVNEEDLARLERGDGLFEERSETNNDARREIARRESSPMPLSHINLNESVLRTPTKRARRTNADTPSKRSRRTQFETLENQENIPPVQEPMNISPTHPTATVNQPFIEHPSRMILDADLLEIERTVDISNNLVTQVPESSSSHVHSSATTSDFSLEPVSMSERLPRRRTRRIKFLDTKTHISNDDMRTQIANPLVLTRPIAEVRVDIDRIHLDSQLLFSIPSTSVRFKSESMWADVLLEKFLENIEGPFHVDNDGPWFPEFVRARDTTEKTAELSDDIDRHTLQIPDPPNGSVTDTVALVRDISHVEIHHNPVDVGNIEIFNQQVPESAFEATLEDQTTIAPVALEPTEKSVRSSSSDYSFMPHTSKERSAHSRSSSGDKTINIDNVPSSPRSSADSREFSPLWTKEKLLVELKTLWDRNLQMSPITFKEVFPPETTMKSDGVCGILDLLQLATESEIQLQQAEPYAELYIYLDFD